jgi:hypothetical protein
MKNIRLLSLIMLANLFSYAAANAQDVLTGGEKLMCFLLKPF